MKKILIFFVFVGILFSYWCGKNIEEKNTDNLIKNQEIKQDKVGNISLWWVSTESGSIFSWSTQ